MKEETEQWRLEQYQFAGQHVIGIGSDTDTRLCKREVAHVFFDEDVGVILYAPDLLKVCRQAIEAIEMERGVEQQRGNVITTKLEFAERRLRLLVSLVESYVPSIPKEAA